MDHPRAPLLPLLTLNHRGTRVFGPDAWMVTAWMRKVRADYLLGVLQRNTGPKADSYQVSKISRIILLKGFLGCAADRGGSKAAEDAPVWAAQRSTAGRGGKNWCRSTEDWSSSARSPCPAGAACSAWLLQDV